MSHSNDIQGVNAGCILELHERYTRDPRVGRSPNPCIFEHWHPPGGFAPDAQSSLPLPIEKIVGAANLAQAIRAFGHLPARLDPLGSPPPDDPALHLETHGLKEGDLERLPAHLIGGPAAEGKANAREAIDALRTIYSSTTGHDFDHINIPEERDWLRHAVESQRFRPPNDEIDEVQLLERLTQVEVFEKFLHRVFPGKFRFSIEGLDVMVPMMDEIISSAVDFGIHNLLIGMAHRGRLNFLAHVLRKPYAQILAEFKDPFSRMDATALNEMGFTGDVKYHRGTSLDLREGQQVSLRIRMAPNPSHLEAVNPVVMGMARAIGTRVNKRGAPRFDHTITLPVLIHGDAAFPGQGIVAETLNMSSLHGYRIGGTLHIIANNQLGFTTNPAAGRSTMCASDLAKGFEIPIIHVNADDPIGCIETTRMACAYRARFQKDFLIDVVGYRRFGHNEGDEPAFTQPRMYEKITEHPTVRELWGRRLVSTGVVEENRLAEFEQKYNDVLQREYEALKPEEDIRHPHPKPPPPGAARRVKTSVSAERLSAINQALGRLPGDFEMHSKLAKAIQKRRETIESGGERAIDWTSAEELAYASILEEGIAIRLTGQDSKRGTFSHRHAVYWDQKSGKTHAPLQHLTQSKAAFEIRNSPLTENATIGFEYGYNMQRPHRLVIWEAQYGDFINGAQVIIDEFLVSARAKWGQTPSLVLLLPHGHEGAGPDHSSGRLERFLSMAADINMRVANCTTAAQFFHLLRRQALLLRTDPLPLIIMSPKSLLRNPAIASSIKDLTDGHWQPVIDDPAIVEPERVRRLVLCSGKVYVDLTSMKEEPPTRAEVAIVRVEQLYPFPKEDLNEVIARYPNLERVVWLQEEPQNMGAWSFVQPILTEMLEGRWELHYLGRPRYSSPSEGSSAWHAYNQQILTQKAFELDTEEAKTKETALAGK